MASSPSTEQSPVHEPSNRSSASEKFRSNWTAFGWWAFGLITPFIGAAIAVWLMLLWIGDSTQGSGLMVIFAAPAGFLLAAPLAVMFAWQIERNDRSPAAFLSRNALAALGAITPFFLALAVGGIAAAVSAG